MVNRQLLVLMHPYLLTIGSLIREKTDYVFHQLRVLLCLKTLNSNKVHCGLRYNGILQEVNKVSINRIMRLI